MKDTNIKYDVILFGCKNRLCELDPLINYYYGRYTHLDARLKKKKNTTTARRITVASSVYKFTEDKLFKILYINLLKIL